jgi:CubicO group peptidase (beta-lactamase class C family)
MKEAELNQALEHDAARKAAEANISVTSGGSTPPGAVRFSPGVSTAGVVFISTIADMAKDGARLCLEKAQALVESVQASKSNSATLLEAAELIKMAERLDLLADKQVAR